MQPDTETENVPRLSTELSGAEFGDLRLTQRLRVIVDAVTEKPAEGFPEIMGNDAALEGTYRFLNNGRVTPERILAPHYAATTARVVGEGRALVIHDTSEFKFGGEVPREGLGPLRGKGQGFLGHFALAVGQHKPHRPLGLMGLETWTRKAKKVRGKRSRTEVAKDSERESLRWARLVEEVEGRLGGRAQLIHVMDREGDSYDLFAGLKAAGRRFVIRASHDRVLEGFETVDGQQVNKLFEALGTARHVFEREVPISTRRKSKEPKARKIHPPRGARVAKLAFKAATVTVKRPRYGSKALPKSLKLNVVWVHEVDTPAGVDPVDWKIVTTEPVDTPEQLGEVVDIYRGRWLIEEFFQALKTGCAYQKRQLESLDALLRALAILAPVAWQLLLLRYVSRTEPDTCASEVLTPTQIEVLVAVSKIKLPKRPTVRQAMLAVAKLAGHLKRNGEPGWRLLGRGFDKLLFMEQGWLAAMATGGCDQS